MYIGHNSEVRDLVLQTNETDRLVIKGCNGNVGIGINDPTTSLHVKDTATIESSGALSTLYLKNSSTNGKKYYVNSNYFTLLLWKAVLPIPTGENWREYHHNVLIRNRLHPSCGSFPVVLPLAGPCPRVPGRGARPPRPPQIAGGQELGERDLVFFHAQKTTRRVKFRCAGRFRYRLTSMATSFFLPAVTTTVFRTGLNPSAAVWIV